MTDRHARLVANVVLGVAGGALAYGLLASPDRRRRIVGATRVALTSPLVVVLLEEARRLLTAAPRAAPVASYNQEDAHRHRVGDFSG